MHFTNQCGYVIVPQHWRGIIATLVATLLFSVQDAITKHLMGHIHITQILFVRYLAFSLFALYFCSRHGDIRSAIKTKRPWLQISRGLIIVTEMAVFAYALHFLGVAPTHALFATFPLMVTALSAPLLGEVVGWRRWIAVFIGFIGTLIILKPGFGMFHPAALIALIAAFMFAVYSLLTRIAGRSDSFNSSLLYFGLVGLGVSSLLVPFYWQPISGHDKAWLLVISLTGISGHYLFIKALELTPAVILQPFNYFILVWAIIVGYLVYGEVLSASSLFGALLVISGGLMVARHEYILSKRAGVKLSSD